MQPEDVREDRFKVATFNATTRLRLTHLPTGHTVERVHLSVNTARKAAWAELERIVSEAYAP